MIGTVRRAARNARVFARQLDISQRPLPGFLVIGAQRGGTTSLYDALTQHPSVAAAIVKEIHYFDAEYGRGERWYRAHFPRTRVGERAPMAGEATPSYLYDPRVPSRVHALLPQVRVLVALREPVDRAWSHYLRERRMGRERLSFEEAVEREQERLASDGDDYRGTHHRFHSYLARGAYAEQLERWLSYVPRERMLVVRSEDFYHSPLEILRRAYSFLDLPAFDPRKLRRLQEGGGQPIDPVIRARLRDYFQKDQERLTALLGPESQWSA